MLNSPFAPWPAFTQEEADAVSRVLLSGKVNYWTGDESRQFESEFAEFAGTSHAIAVANGTLALDLALHGLMVGGHNGGTFDDEVIVTSRSFLASASAIVNAGARPVFVDVDENTQNLDPVCVSGAITSRTRAVLCVHLAGWPCDMDALRDVIKPRDIFLIEDCAQAHGAIYKGQPVGGLGDVAAWSFCQDKIMTTGGEGGMVTCNDTSLWKRMWAFKDHGKSWDAVYNQTHPPGFRWLHESFGTNWRITELQSVLGRIQLGRMPSWQQARNDHATLLNNAFAPFSDPSGPIRIPQLRHRGCACPAAECSCQHAWYKFYVFIRPEHLRNGWNRDRIISEMNTLGLPCMQGSCSEMYLEKAFADTGYRPTNSLPVAKKLGETSIMMMTHPTLTAKNMAHARDVISQVLETARI